MAGRNSCCVCKKNVTKEKNPGLECEGCKLLFHFEPCSKMTAQEFELVEKGRCTWKCKNCRVTRKSIVFGRKDSSSSEIGTDQVNEKSLDTKAELDLIKASQDEIIGGVNVLRELILNIIDKFEAVSNTLDQLNGIDTKIDKLNRNISKIEERICKQAMVRNENEIENQKIRYSDVIMNPALIVKPKNVKQTSETTTSEIKQNIENPSDFKVKGMRTINNGCVLVSCENDESIEKIRDEMKTKLGDSYSITIPMKRVMQLKIYGLSRLYTKEELTDKIKLQNKSFSPESKINVVHMKDNANGGFAIIETDETTHNELLSIGRVGIDWDSCRVYEYGNVVRCFKCQAFHHTAHNCRNGDKCGRCSGNHKSRDCQSDSVKCINCSLFNEHSTLEIKDDHCAWDPKCSVYIHKSENERKRLNFLK